MMVERDRSTSVHRSTQISPRRLPVIIVSHRNRPHAGSPCFVDDRRKLLRGWRVRLWRSEGRRLGQGSGVLSEVTPLHRAVECRSEDEVNGANRAVRQGFALMILVRSQATAVVLAGL